MLVARCLSARMQNSDNEQLSDEQPRNEQPVARQRTVAGGRTDKQHATVVHRLSHVAAMRSTHYAYLPTILTILYLLTIQQLTPCPPAPWLLGHWATLMWCLRWPHPGLQKVATGATAGREKFSESGEIWEIWESWNLEICKSGKLESENLETEKIKRIKFSE